MHIGMMDEDLQRVLLFLVDTLRRMPGWTHQGILKQELLTAPIDGSLHRILGSSSAEIFADFLKSFPNLFCININANQLVQLSTKKGINSQMVGTGFLGGGSEDCSKSREFNISNPESSLGDLSLGLCKPIDMQPQPPEWNSSMFIVPEMNEEKFGYQNHVQNQMMSSPVEANYPARCSTNNYYHDRNGRGSWDPVGFQFADYQHAFVGSSMSCSSSLNHVANGWDQPVMVQHNQIYYDKRHHESLYSQRYSNWDAGTHSITESLKNFTIENDNNDYSALSPHSLPSFGGKNSPDAGWLAMANNAPLDSFANNQPTSEANLLKNVSSLWDDSLRSRKSSSSVAQFVDPTTQDTAALNYRVPDMMNTINTHPPSNISYKEWNVQQDEEPFTGFLAASSAKTSQQYYGWKAPTTQTAITEPPLAEFAIEENNAELIAEETATIPFLEMDSNSSEPKEYEPSCTLDLTAVVNPQVETIQPVVAATDIPPFSKKANTLSYAEAVRCNAQRRRTDSENGSISSCSGIVALNSSTQSTINTPQKLFSHAERSAKSRRNLDGRCGKVESLKPENGVLRLGNGKVFFDRSVFFDVGKAVADLRNSLKINDTVYFDATLDGNDQEWKATLAWIGKKPRSTSLSTTSANLGRTSFGLSSEGHLNAFNGGDQSVCNNNNTGGGQKSSVKDLNSTSLDCTVEGNGEVFILFAHFGFIKRGKRFKENVHFNRNVFYASGNRVKELTDTLKEKVSIVNYIAVPSNKKSCAWKATLVWTGPRPKV